LVQAVMTTTPPKFKPILPSSPHTKIRQRKNFLLSSQAARRLHFAK
jgi:hypothetical protein